MNTKSDLVDARDLVINYLRIRMSEEEFRSAVVNQISTKIKNSIYKHLPSNTGKNNTIPTVISSERNYHDIVDIEYNIANNTKGDNGVLFRLQINLILAESEANLITINQIIDSIINFCISSDPRHTWQAKIQGHNVHLGWNLKVQPIPLLVLCKTELLNECSEFYSWHEVYQSQNLDVMILPEAVPKVVVKQEWLSIFENTPLNKKLWIAASAVGIISFLVMAGVSFLGISIIAEEIPSAVIHQMHKAAWMMSLLAGVATFGISLFIGKIITKQIKLTVDNLQAQIDEIQQQAEEQAQGKKDLLEEVIRLLDDVEGAARGDLTVEAEVTCCVVGAVADSFNLTVQNMRDIVQEVKLAARQVYQAAIKTKKFVRSLEFTQGETAEEQLRILEVQLRLVGISRNLLTSVERFRVE